MNNFSYYTDTRIEYELALKRLKVLEDRKMEIWQRYFGVKSPQWDKVGSPGSHDDADKMVRYLAEISRSDGNSPSLEEGIEKLKKEAQELKKVLRGMEKRLEHTDTIEGRLYFLVVVKRYTVNRAIREVAEAEFMSEKNVWKTYYPKIKEDIRKLRRK